MDTEDRWFVRFRGHTLGPLTSDQVKSSLRLKELGPTDKIAHAKNPAWQPLEAVAHFSAYWKELNPGWAKKPEPLPPPQVLWKRKKVPLPKAPAAPAPIPDFPAAQAIAPAIDPKKEKEAPAKRAITPATKRKAKGKPAPKKKPVLQKKKASPRQKERPEKEDPVLQAETSVPEINPAPVTEPAPQLPVPPEAPALEESLKFAKDTLSLLDTLKEWSRMEQELAKRVTVEDFPARPEVPPIQWAAPPPPKPSGPKRIELHLNASKNFLALTGIIAALLLAASLILFTDPQKTRDLEDTRLPDPSSPTVQPSVNDDPIPSLKAPTRPKRE